MATKVTGKSQKSVVTNLVVDNRKITDDNQKAEVFGQHFAKVSSDDNLKEPLRSIKNIVEHGYTVAKRK